MSDLKYVYIPAAGVFILSLLTGILSGVGFLTLLVRAVMFGLVFGAFGFGVKQLLGRFLPELFDTGEAVAEPSDDTGQPDRPEQENRTVDIVVESDDDEAVSLYSVSDDDVDEAETPAVLAGGDEEAEAGYNDGEDLGDVEELEPVDVSPGGSLPDLDSFSDSFQSVADSQELSGDSTAERHSMEVDVLGTQQDPQTMAKAVRTFMKKDQEG